MRISDWSSDVCSSDLRLQDGGTYREVGGKRPPGDEGRQALPDRQGKGVRRRVPDEPAVRPVLPLAGYAECLTARPFCRHSAMELASLFTAILKRSEEHTSELQSLMRISYAVFCLKK